MGTADSAAAAARAARRRNKGKKSVFKAPEGWTADHTCYGHPEWSKAQCDKARRRAKERSTAAATRG